IDSTVVDAQAVALVSAWITNDLPSYVSFPGWQTNYFGGTNAPNSDAQADADGDGAKNYLEYLTQTNPTNSLDAWSISVVLSNGVPQIVFPQISNRAFEVQATLGPLGSPSWSPLDVADNAP